MKPAHDAAFMRAAVAAGLTLVKVNWGIGQMAMPYYLEKAGVWSGIAFFLLSMGLTYVGITRILRTRDALEQRAATDDDDHRLAKHHPPRVATRIGGADEPRSDASSLDATQPLAPASSQPLMMADDDDPAASLFFAARGDDDGPAAAAAPPPPPRLPTYGAIVGAALGPRAEQLSLACICVAMFGSNVAYLKFIADNAARFAGVFSRGAWTALATAAVLPFAALDDIERLSPVSGAGLVLGLAFEGVVLVRAASTLGARACVAAPRQRTKGEEHTVKFACACVRVYV